MAYYDYDLEGNTISIFKGQKRKNQTLSTGAENDDFNVLEIDGKFAGIKLKDAYVKYEREGKIGEESFKQLIESQGIPSMFIGQNPLGVEFNSVLNSNRKRPDFIINPPNKGSILVDVKSRSYLGTDCYTCDIVDLQSLVELDREVRIPVWLAFTYSNELSKDFSKVNWHLANASTLLKFAQAYEQQMNQKFPDKLCKYIRLPHKLFATFQNQLYFDAPISFSNDDVKKAVQTYIDEHEKILDSLFPLCKHMTKKKEVNYQVSEYVKAEKFQSGLYHSEIKEVLYASLEL